MTIHSGVDYKCSHCGVDFVPIPESFNCPKCGQKAEVIFTEFVDEAVRSAFYNIGKYRRVVPPAWGFIRTGDRYYWIAFQFVSFLSHKLKQDEIEVMFWRFKKNKAQSLASQFLSMVDLGDESYLTDNLKIYLTSFLHIAEKTELAGPVKIDESLIKYSCFLCYSSKDKAFADKLYSDLVGRGAACWYFPEDATWGKKMWKEIDTGIKSCDKVIVACSVNSLNSEPVIREIERVLQREDLERKDILLPISIDNYLFENWEHHRKSDVLGKVIGDFRNWPNKESYSASLSRLIDAIQS